MAENQSLLGFVRGILRILRGRPRIPPSLQDNPLLQTILRRRSVRKFKDQEIPEDVFAAILEAARLAPSTVNLQTWSFAVFTAQSWHQKFERPIPFRAQRAVIVLGDIHRARSIFPDFPYSPLVEFSIAVMNASLAAMNMNIAAEALGVSSVMLSETGRSGLLDARYLKEKLSLPENVFPIMTIVFGYAQGAYPPMPPRFSPATIFFTDRYPEAEEHVKKEWLESMIAGYKASFPNSSFDKQLNLYLSKIENAEADLHRMVFYRDNSPQ